MMTKDELKDCLRELRVAADEAAILLGVTPRTFRRWIDGEEIPGPAQAALTAWVRLARRNLAWKPDSLSVFTDDKDQIERQNRHATDLDTMLSRVEARGGPKDPWRSCPAAWCMSAVWLVIIGLVWPDLSCWHC